MIIVAKILLWTLRVLNFGLTLLIYIFLISFGLQFIPRATSYPLVQQLNHYVQPFFDYVSHLIPTGFGGYDFSALVIIVVILILKNILNRIIGALSDWIIMHAPKRKISGGATIPAPLSSVIHEEPKSRKSLLRQWIDIKDELEKSQRLLAFLAVDVIGSTKMKEGEDTHLIEYTFSEYKKFIEEILNTNNVWKVAWTPDGLMSAFLTMEDAIKAGKEIIVGLDAFNKVVNQLKTPIRVRCGLNYGKVVFDIDARMEEVTHRVIDIAGHLQKSAEPDSIWVAKEVFDYLSTKEKTEGFQQVQIKVDDKEVVEWSKS